MKLSAIAPKKIVIAAAVPAALLASGGMVWQASYSAFADHHEPDQQLGVGHRQARRRRQQHRDVQRDEPQARLDRQQVHPGHVDRLAGLRRQALRHVDSTTNALASYITSRSTRAPAPPSAAVAAPSPPARSTTARSPPSAPARPVTAPASAPGPRPDSGSETKSWTASPTRVEHHPEHGAGRHRGPRPHLGVAEQLTRRTTLIGDPHGRHARHRHHLGDTPRWGRVLCVAAARGLLAVVASLLLWGLVPAVLGWQPQLILTGSMEPRIMPGDLVVTRPVDPSTLHLGQVVTVDDPDHDDGRTRTHRIVRIDDHGDLVLRGDNNPMDDSSPVPLDTVHGVGVLRVPFVGRPLLWLGQHQYLPLGLTLLALAWAVSTVLGGLGTRRDDAEDSDDHDDHDASDDAGPPGQRATGDGSSALVGQRRRRLGTGILGLVVATLALGSAPADAAFRQAIGNPTSCSAPPPASAPPTSTPCSATAPTSTGGSTRRADSPSPTPPATTATARS